MSDYKGKDEIANFIEHNPGLPGSYIVAMAKFGWHAALYNFANQFIQENSQAIDEGDIWIGAVEGCLPLLFERGLGGNDIPLQLRDSDERIFFVQCVIDAMLKIAEGFAADNQAKAHLFQNILGVDASIEAFKYHDDVEDG